MKEHFLFVPGLSKGNKNVNSLELLNVPENNIRRKFTRRLLTEQPTEKIEGELPILKKVKPNAKLNSFIFHASLPNYGFGIKTLLLKEIDDLLPSNCIEYPIDIVDVEDQYTYVYFPAYTKQVVDFERSLFVIRSSEESNYPVKGSIHKIDPEELELLINQNMVDKLNRIINFSIFLNDDKSTEHIVRDATLIRSFIISSELKNRLDSLKMTGYLTTSAMDLAIPKIYMQGALEIELDTFKFLNNH